jgi:two-component system, chemotaxis family, CheB/CheR fusion protein
VPKESGIAFVVIQHLDYPELSDHVQEVLRKLSFVENVVPTRSGGWFLLRIMPYRTQGNRIDGVVITCSDITAAKKIETGQREEIARLKQLLAEN